MEIMEIKQIVFCAFKINFQCKHLNFSENVLFENILSNSTATVWEYLQGRNNEDEIWLKDANFRIHCIG